MTSGAGMSDVHGLMVTAPEMGRECGDEGEQEPRPETDEINSIDIYYRQKLSVLHYRLDKMCLTQLR